MKFRILGGGWYGSHISHHLIQLGHQVELHEIAGTSSSQNSENAGSTMLWIGYSR